jgi:hypothetical protein
MVKDVLRLTTEGISDLVVEIAWGLHNQRVSCRVTRCLRSIGRALRTLLKFDNVYSPVKSKAPLQATANAVYSVPLKFGPLNNLRTVGSNLEQF